MTSNRLIGRPPRVGRALVVFWAAWLASAMALFLNQIVYKGAGIGPGWRLGTLSLAVQAGVFAFVGRGSRVARALSVVFLLLAALPMQLLGRLIAEGAVFSASYTAASFALKATGVFLLFTGDANRWFARAGGL